MGRRKSRYREIVIHIVSGCFQTGGEVIETKPAVEANEPSNFFSRIYQWWTQHTDRDASGEPQTYTAYIYSDLSIKGLDESTPPPSSYLKDMGDLRLIGSGQISVRWDRYREYLRAFSHGEKAAYKKFWGVAETEVDSKIDTVKVRDQLFEMRTPALQQLFSGGMDLGAKMLRIWLHCTPPELGDLPWELMVCELRWKQTSRFSFVRGTPPDPHPKLSVTGKLRLAFIHDGQNTPNSLLKAIEEIKSTLDVVEMTDSPRQAVKRAAAEGFELMHIVSDAALSSGHEGLLYLHEPSSESSGSETVTPAVARMYRIALGSPNLFKWIFRNEQLLEWNKKLMDKLDIEPCSTSDLNVTLRGSRVTLLSLSVPKTDSSSLGGTLPSVYCAFASIGSSRDLPNVVAPLGVCDEKSLGTFWSNFYRQLMAETLSTSRDPKPSFSLEAAMSAGLEAAPTALMALFLRQRYGREFTSRPITVGENHEDPTHVAFKLQAQRRLIDQLRAIDSNYLDIESKIFETPLVQAETERHMKLSEEINFLAEVEEDEL